MKVKVISRKQHVALVEWIESVDGNPLYRRSILPASELASMNGKHAEHADPEIGIPYGAAWEEHLEAGGLSTGAAAAIANELRRAGIWTVAELEARRDTARAAFQRAYSMDVQRLAAAARQRQPGG